jgi:hypothetical protein
VEDEPGVVAEVVVPVDRDEEDPAPRQRGEEHPEREIADPVGVLSLAAGLPLRERDGGDEAGGDEEPVGVQRQRELPLEDARPPQEHEPRRQRAQRPPVIPQGRTPADLLLPLGHPPAERPRARDGHRRDHQDRDRHHQLRRDGEREEDREHAI